MTALFLTSSSYSKSYISILLLDHSEVTANKQIHRSDWFLLSSLLLFLLLRKTFSGTDLITPLSPSWMIIPWLDDCSICWLTPIRSSVLNCSFGGRCCFSNCPRTTLLTCADPGCLCPCSLSKELFLANLFNGILGYYLSYTDDQPLCWLNQSPSLMQVVFLILGISMVLGEIELNLQGNTGEEEERSIGDFDVLAILVRVERDDMM